MNFFDYLGIRRNNFDQFKHENMDYNSVLLQDNVSSLCQLQIDVLQITSKTLDIPSKSSGINPKKNIWRILVCRVYAKRMLFDSILELIAVLLEIWKLIPITTVINFAKSFSKCPFDNHQC